MSSNRARQFLLFLSVGLFFYGIIRSFKGGGEDFRVFHHAAELVAQGKGLEIYADSPDRYLYAPGFAWLLAPVGMLPFTLGLVLWSGLKTFAFISMVRSLSSRFSLLAALLGTLFFVRPLLTELKYGQVNLLIVTAFVFAIDEFLKPSPQHRRLFFSWLIYAVAAVAKLFPAVLIWIPFLPMGDRRSKYLSARLGVCAGAVLLFFIPFLTEGLSGGMNLYFLWRDALLAKGFPTETHNQSFLAFLVHTFTDEGFFSLMRGPTKFDYSWFSVPKSVLYVLGMVWSVAVGGFIFLGSFWFTRTRDVRLACVLIALTVLPSHLVWKPYFVFMIPLAIACFSHALATQNRRALQVLGFGVLLVNLTSFDFVGRAMAARLEAHALLLWVSVALIVYLLVSRKASSRLSGSSPGSSA